MSHPELIPADQPLPQAAPTWLYGLTTLPFGVASGFSGIAMPFVMRNAGVAGDRIAEIVAISLLPAAWQFLWAPIIDLGPRRKHWLVALAALGSICIFLAMVVPLPSSLSLFVVLSVAGQALVGLTGSCNGGLMATTLPDSVRGSAGGWSNAGNLGGAALGAGVTMWLSDRLAPQWVGAATATMIFLPSLVALAIPETARPKRRLVELFGTMLGSVWRTVRSRPGFVGILICISPCGTAAAMNLFSSMGPDYGASNNVVTFVTGFAGGLVTAVGSLVGGYLCDRMPRRLAYISAGLLTAACSLAMSFFPLTPSTFIYGASIYLFVAGLCYASFSALVLEIVGNAGAAASTQYTLLTAAANQAISYTTLFLGFGRLHWGGAPGMLRADAGANVAGAVFLGIVMLFVAQLARSKPVLATTD